MPRYAHVFLSLFQRCVQAGLPRAPAVLEAPLWLDVVNCRLASSLLGTEVLWGPQRAVLCWARLCADGFLSDPTVGPASLSVLSCSPVLRHNEILCFPPSLNFGMKMGLESGALLSHLMN